MLPDTIIDLAQERQRRQAQMPDLHHCLCRPCQQLAIDGNGPLCIRCHEYGCNPPLIWCQATPDTLDVPEPKPHLEVDMDQSKTLDKDQTSIVPQFQQALSKHGLDTTKLDQNQWQTIVDEVKPLFTSREYPSGGGSYDR